MLHLAMSLRRSSHRHHILIVLLQLLHPQVAYVEWVLLSCAVPLLLSIPNLLTWPASLHLSILPQRQIEFSSGRPCSPHHHETLRLPLVLNSLLHLHHRCQKLTFRRIQTRAVNLARSFNIRFGFCKLLNYNQSFLQVGVLGFWGFGV